MKKSIVLIPLNSLIKKSVRLFVRGRARGDVLTVCEHYSPGQTFHCTHRLMVAKTVTKNVTSPWARYRVTENV